MSEKNSESALSLPKKNFVLGLPIHCIDDYSGYLLSRLEKGLGTHVVTLNAEMVMQGEKNHVLAEIISRAELVVPDGAGVVLYLRLKGKSVQRCPGIELAESLLWQVPRQNPDNLVFFYGGKPGVAMKAADIWQQKVSQLAVACQHGYLSPAEETELLNTLAQLQPKLIFVGLGVPRQELWIAEHKHICPQAVWIGIGGSLDIWAGVKERAPAWFCDNSLEWLYRLYQEPWRWRRMLALPHFALKTLMDVKF
ncbi:WecB/TagA/CpsF family glycosyltransferase [Okeania sp. SIO2B3]|uniref:WecB/TagA/CpsF family glycosyltransferase n=1 Tax=Okeania sp. SIO2B3 TaxID=2607784 RepID=UPI0013C0026B|nr:WecB/TagA/CpsF family glycosyltransferase [Okeania sp. SIO2B3]NEN91931.1 WecB/TagA/CpsF family glycosyltransferase [Okeania sp. SIO3H1]NET42510.1 WecB/TagA/CpsF family glycosyltransferase [Okeania sp. SIO2B3]